MDARSPPPAPARSEATVLGLPGREWPIVVVALAIAALPSVMPVMVGALIRQFGIGVDKAGFAISANMAGILAGTLCAPLVIPRLTDRTILYAGLLVLAGGNILTLGVHAYGPLVATRLVSGWGEGLAGAVAYSLMGRSSLPTRMVATYAGGQALIGVVGMAALPGLTQRFGPAAFYGPITVLVLLSLLAVRPAANATPRPAAMRGTVRRGSAAAGPAAVLAGLFAHFTGMTTVWAFLQKIGADHGLAGTVVALALSMSAVAALAGSAAASLLARRLGVLPSLLIGAVLVLACAAGLLARSPAVFIGATCLLSFTWAAQYPFMFRRLAERDVQGRWAALTPVATASALSVGPALGGVLLQRGGLASVDIAFVAFTLTGLALTAATYLRFRFSPVA